MFGITLHDTESQPGKTVLKVHEDSCKLPPGVMRRWVIQEHYGPKWQQCATPMQQEKWQEHLDYWIKQILEGKAEMAGPYDKLDGALVILAKHIETFEEAEAIMKGDPWHQADIVVSTVRLWAHSTAIVIG